MENGNTIHPDFLRTLSAAQTAWLTANGIEATEGERFGFYFSKDERYILPIPATAGAVYLMERDDHEDGDGEIQVGSFDTLRSALLELVKVTA